MGKIRVKTLGLEEVEKKQAEEAKARRAAKKVAEKPMQDDKTKTAKRKSEETKKPKVSKAQGRKSQSQVDETQAKKLERAQKVAEGTESSEDTDEKKSKKQAKIKIRGDSYLKAKKLVDPAKSYKLTEALKILRKMQYAKFDEAVELHINTKESGLKGEVSLPHGTGKKLRVTVVDDEVLKKIEAGVIDFDILVAAPSDMPRLVKFARVLGPKGLMPNPKAGTVSEKPEAAAKKFQAGALRFKSEPKFPLIHQTVGKVSFKDEQLTENIVAFIKAVKPQNISAVFLKSSMSPSIRLKVE